MEAFRAGVLSRATLMEASRKKIFASVREGLFGGSGRGTGNGLRGDTFHGSRNHFEELGDRGNADFWRDVG